MKYSTLAAGFLFAVVAIPVSAQQLVYTAELSGSAENPSNPSPGVGMATVTIDMAQATMRVEETFSGLLAVNTASHIHCCITAPGNIGVATTVPTFTDFPGV